LNGKSLAGSYSIATEQGVSLSYTPCDRYTGDVQLLCTTLRGSDDCASSLPKTFIYLIALNIQAKRNYLFFIQFRVFVGADEKKATWTCQTFLWRPRAAAS
jgi:hypothetical protein